VNDVNQTNITQLWCVNHLLQDIARNDRVQHVLQGTLQNDTYDIIVLILF